MSPAEQDQSVIQLVTAVTEVKTTLEHMSEDMRSMKTDVKQIREGAPLHRIQVLEARWRAVAAWLGGLTLVVIGAIVTHILTR